MPPSDENKPNVNLAVRDRRIVTIFFALAAVVLIADLVLKHYSFKHVAGYPIDVNHQSIHDPDLIPQHDGITLVPNVLALKLTINHGAVFGLGAGGRLFFIAVTFIAIAMILTIFGRSDRRQRVMHTALSLILAGALGNLYDRIFHGAVRDMLYLFPGVHLPFGWSWPGGNRELYPWIFNIADVALVIGVGLMLLTLLRTPKEESEGQ